MSASTDNYQKIAICIPTLLRLRLLEQCLLANGKVKIPPACQVFMIVVDNDKNGSAQKVCNKARELNGPEIKYVIEPERGLASARNRLLNEAAKNNADYIAFIDDDEYPTENWLIRHIEAIAAHQADVSCGPVEQADPDKQASIGISKKSGRKKIQPRYISTNNVVFNIKLVSIWNLKFDVFYNFIGGEDFDFFLRASAQGAKSIWTPDAHVYETLIESRKSMRYLLFRHFTGGINNVLRYKRNYGTLRAWLHFIPKATGKLLGATVYLAIAAFAEHHARIRISAKCLASSIGYFSGLCNIVIERYRTIDGE